MLSLVDRSKSIVFIPTTHERPTDWLHDAIDSVRMNGRDVVLAEDFAKRGKSWAMNSAISFLDIKSGMPKYFAVLDDDDYLKPGVLEYCEGVMEDHPEVGWMTTDYQDVDEDGRAIEMPHAAPACANDLVNDAEARCGYGFKFFRTKAFFSVGGYNSTVYSLDDYGLCYNLALHGWKTLYKPTRFWCWRNHPGQITKSDGSMKAYRAAIRAWLRSIPKRPLEMLH